MPLKKRMPPKNISGLAKRLPFQKFLRKSRVLRNKKRLLPEEKILIILNNPNLLEMDRRELLQRLKRMQELPLEKQAMLKEKLVEEFRARLKK